jgi:uncharacterized membrane protein
LSTESRLHRAFQITAALKGFNAALEFLAGILFYALPASSIAAAAEWLSQTELLEDPRDVVARPLHDWAVSFSISSDSFYATYLLAHGLIKLVLVFGLLSGRRWTYPPAMAALGAFVVYQLHRYSFTQSNWLLVLSAFDLILLVLVWREYRAGRSSAIGAKSHLA